MLIKSDARLELKFQAIFKDFWSQNGPSRGPQNRLKMRFFGTWAPRPPQRPPFPPAAIFEPPDLIFSYFRTSGAHFQAPWPVWGAAHWRPGHGALVAPEGPLAKRLVD